MPGRHELAISRLSWLAIIPACLAKIGILVPARGDCGFGLLSGESVRTLALQGGPMTPEQAAVFTALPFAHDAVAVRRWDDQAKDSSVTPPEFGHFEALLRDLLSAG
jgi:hypothetical protein